MMMIEGRWSAVVVVVGERCTAAAMRVCVVRCAKVVGKRREKGETDE